MTTVAIDKVNGTPAVDREPRFDPIALAEAEAIRTRAEAEAEATRIEAEGKAEADKIKATEEARRQKILNDKAEARAREEQAARDARIAESNRKRKDAERAQADADEKERQAEEDAAKIAAEVAAADEQWRAYAIRFAIVCGIVSLPVQMSFFWDRQAPWMAAAPIMLEGAAWVVHRGARAAAVSGRTVWHYRAIVWLLALIAAGVNLYHGLHSFDPGTAIATAFASIAGPGVWDLHEHGRIRRRDGVPSRRERRAQKKEAKRLAAEKAEKELREAERQAYREKSEREAAEELDRIRREEFPEVHRHAWRLAADLGKSAMTDAIWRQAKLDVDGAPPGESADVIRMRNAAERRVEAARNSTPVSTLSKTTNAQRAIQVKASRKGSSYKPVPPLRRRGDSPRFHPAAKALAADAKRAANATNSNA
ncbi:hypothetical protein [Streptomyces lydicamycinicus]|uniref:hypothetical protein n=1 Tax=Streptomyces lydicamycinicus TaxID=1546107 RepID=UPI003C2C8EB0